jgi:hypothetical protein
MAITVAGGENAKNPTVATATAGSAHHEVQAAEPEALEVLVEEDEDEAELDDEVAVDDFDSDDLELDEAGELLDDEPRLSLR